MSSLQNLKPLKPLLPLLLHFSTSSSSSSSSLLQAKLLHQNLITTRGTLSHPKIISLYLSSNSPSLALSTLLHLPPSTSHVFFWNTLIANANANANANAIANANANAISLFNLMRRHAFPPDSYTYPYAIKASSHLKSLSLGASLHCLALRDGFGGNVFVGNAVVAMYGRCGAVGDARKVFDEMLRGGIGDLVSWNSIAVVYVHSGDCGRALEVFELMVRRGGCRPDVISLINVLAACASLKRWGLGEEVHCYALRGGLIGDVFVGNGLVDMYAKCGLMERAERVFGRMEVRDVVSWNAMVTGYSQVGRFDDALDLLKRMRKEEIELNVVAWSAVIAGYAQRGMGYQALDVFREMMHSGTNPNVITLVSVLSGCAAVGALRQGKETHCYSLKRVFDVEGHDCGENMMVVNGLIDMYAKCKDLDTAESMFELIELSARCVVTWTVMIGGYAQHGDANTALKLFADMMQHKKGVIPNSFTIACCLVACARLGDLRFGKQIHGYVLRNRYESTMLFVSNCLIDMYVKSGDIEAARVVFDSMKEKNTVSWTSVMTGYGMHGREEEALQVFERMRRTGYSIDAVTIRVVLYACSHSGMVDLGINYFNNMSRDFGVNPEVDHYACMVDLFGRAGRLSDAMKFIEDMPMKPNAVIWTGLMGACRLHSNVELGEYAAKKLSEMEYESDGTYTLLSNIYASARRWKDVARIRSLMKKTGIKKRPGCSFVQGKKSNALFYVGDRSHPMSPAIYNLLADLIDRIKVMGYVPETGYALHDVDDEEKGNLLFEHSEKLALAYGLLTTSPGVPITIIKNLRVCGDCHTAMTYISKIVPHEIILRDSSRFHHIKNGSCSCKGYW